MVARLIAFSVAVFIVGCNRLSPAEAKVVGSWKTQTSPESVTIFTFEPNHTTWCAVTVREDTWLDGDGHWHIDAKQIVIDDMTYPRVSEEYARKNPDLAKRPRHYTGSLEQLDNDTIKLEGVTLIRTERPTKPKKKAPFSP